MEPLTPESPQLEPRRPFWPIFWDQFKAFREQDNPLWRSLAYALLFAIDGVDIMDPDKLVLMESMVEPLSSDEPTAELN